MAPLIIQRCKDEGYTLIVIDPIYKLMGDRSENSNDEMASMLNYFDEISEETGGAAVVFCHHYTKGVASTKAQIDRVSGAVFGRHPDGIITLTPHEEPNAFVAEATLRNFPPSPAFPVRWEYPLMEPAHDLDPKKLLTKAGRKPKYSLGQILECLQDGMTTGAWQAAAHEKFGVSASTFAEFKKLAISEERVEPAGKTWIRKAKALRFNPETGKSMWVDREVQRSAG